MAKRILWFIFLALVLIVCALVYLSNYSSAPPAAPNETPAQISAAEHRIRSAVAYPRASRHAKGARTQSGGKTISVQFAQDDVNTMLATNADVQRQLRTAGVEAARIAFEPPSDVRVRAWFDANGDKRQAEVVGLLSPTSAGGITFHTVGTKVGLLPMPPQLTSADIDQRANMLIAKALPSLPLTVSAVDIRNGELVLTGPEKKHK